ncbi:MAG: cell division protein ZapA [Tannerellaceae bacterium]|jgi:cell division protein ZapA|nr:cell division protein ZapA [Tannerellaceae bacterium]
MDDNKFRIRIEIAEKFYGLRICRDEEKLARDAAKQIKKKLEEYRRRYPKDTDMKDWLAMVTFQLSMEYLQLEEKNDTAPFIEKIQQMTKLLEEYLGKNK